MFCNSTNTNYIITIISKSSCCTMYCNILFQNIIHGDNPTNPTGASRRM